MDNNGRTLIQSFLDRGLTKYDIIKELSYLGYQSYDVEQTINSIYSSQSSAEHKDTSDGNAKSNEIGDIGNGVKNKGKPSPSTYAIKIGVIIILIFSFYCLITELNSYVMEENEEKWYDLNRMADQLSARAVYYKNNEKEYRNAEEASNELLKFSERKFGPDHINTAIALKKIVSLNNLNFYDDKKDTEKIKDRIKDICLSNAEGMANDDIDLLKKKKDACILYYSPKDKVLIYQRLYDEYHDNPKYLLKLADSHASQGQFHEAEENYGRVMEIYENDNDTDKIAETLVKIASLQKKKSGYDESDRIEELYLEALSLKEKKHGNESTALINTMREVIIFYEDTGNESEALRYEKRYEKLWDNVPLK